MDITFLAQIKQLNLKALVSLDMQVRLTLDAVGVKEEQAEIMRSLADVGADEILKVTIKREK
ncbi:MAG: hypothetical protein Q7J55_02410 [bacterium]|nr:hypothetical protein [bacterium]